MPITIGIAGITGKFARCVSAQLLKHSDVTIRGYCRDPSRVPESISSSEKVTLFKGDAFDGDAIRTFAQGCDVIICCYLGDDQSRNQTVLQAAVLFFTCLRRPGDAHFVWTITAALCRLAQGMGLHRDGTKFGLTPFELEMRRRLWWSIYLLDSQSSELHAICTQIAEGSYDTQFPLNINDADLSAESTQTPEPHSGFTDMSFCLIRIEMIVSHRRSALGAPGSERNDKDSAKTSGSIGPNAREERLRDLATIHNRLRDRYLQFCDMSEPTQWVTATIIRLALTRSWMIAHLVSGETPGQDPLTEIQTDDPQRDQIFSTAIEVIEFAYLLETDPRTTKWSWFFEAYPQWHAVTIVLSELCVRPQAAETDRAWAVVDKAISRWTERGLQKGGITLEIIYQLMSRAAVVHGRVWSSSEERIRHNSA